MIDSKVVATCLICAVAAGCHAGANAFTDFASIAKPGSTKIQGTTTETSYIASTSTFLVNSTGPSSNGSGSATIVLDSAGNPTALTISGSNSSAAFDASKGDRFGNSAAIGAPGVIAAVNASGTQEALFADPYVSGFNFQTYGVWETGLGSGSGSAGAITVGSATPNGGVPVFGTAKFSGSAGGVYVDAAGNNYFAASGLTVDANFGNRSLSLATSGTQKIDAATAVTSSASNLDMSGTLTYASGSSAFNGQVTTASGLTGSAVGNFYGPNAQELGGTFGVKGAGVEGYIGGFGAKQ